MSESIRTGCPPTDVLALFLRGELSEIELAEVGEHLTQCPDCEARAEVLERTAEDSDQQALSTTLRRVLSTETSEFLGGGLPVDLGARSSNNPVTRVGRYELVELIGRGGMSFVYKAWDSELQRFVALKLVRPDGSGSDVRFRREGEILGQLQHPHLVQVFEAGDTDGVRYIAMELLAGGSLDHVLRDRPMDPPAAAQLVSRIARAAQLAHDNGIVHRDIKPANVLQSADGRVVLTDFGLAKTADAMVGDLTSPSAVLGTPNYMSPEQASCQPVGPWTDVYGLGTVLYQALTGQPPFREAVVTQTLRQIVEADPPSPRALNPGVPWDLQVITLKCLEKTPSRRYPTAAALAADLDRWLRCEPILARPVGRLERAWLWGRRRPTLAFLTTAAVTFLVLGIISSTLLATLASRRAREAELALQAAQTAQSETDQLTRDLLLGSAAEAGNNGRVDEALYTILAALDRTPHDTVRRRAILRNFTAWAEHLPRLMARGRVPSNSTLRLENDVFTLRTDTTCVRLATDGQRLPDGVAIPKLLAVSPDNRWGVVPGASQGVWQLVDLASGRPVGRPLTLLQNEGYDRSPHVHFFRDQHLGIVVTQVDPSGDTWRHIWAIWSIPDGELQVKPTSLVQPAYCPLFFGERPNSTPVALVMNDTGLNGFDTRTGQPTPIAPLATGPATTPDGREVFFGGGRWQIGEGFRPALHFRSTTTGEVSSPSWFLGIVRENHFASVAPDTRLGLKVLPNGRLRYVDISSRKEIAGGALLPSSSISAVAGTATGSGLALADDGQWSLWRFPPRPQPFVSSFTDQYQMAKFNPDASRVYFGRVYKQLGQLCDADTNRTIGRPLIGPSGHASFSRDGRRLATAMLASVNLPSTARVWDAATGSPCSPTITGPQYLQGVGFATDDQTLLLGYVGPVGVWDTATAKSLAVLPHRGPVVGFDLTPDGRTLVTRSRDGWPGGEPGVRFWDTTTWQQIGTRVPTATTPVVAVGPTGTAWVAEQEHLRVQAWNPATGQPLTDAAVLLPNEQALRIAVSPAPDRLAAALPSGEVRLWTLSTRSILGIVPSRSSEVDKLTFHPQGDLAISYADGAVQLIDGDTGTVLGPGWQHRTTILALAFTPDDRLRVALDDGTTETWPIPRPALDDPQRLAEWVSVVAGTVPEQGRLNSLSSDEWATRRDHLGAWSPVPERPPEDVDLREYRDVVRLNPVAGGWYLDRFLKSRPDDWFWRVQRAAQRGRLGDWSGAATDLTAARRSSPEQVQHAVEHEAANAVARQDWATAQWYLDQAIDQSPTNTSLLLQRLTVKLKTAPESAVTAATAAAASGAEPNDLIPVIDQLAGRGDFAAVVRVLSAVKPTDNWPGDVCRKFLLAASATDDDRARKAATDLLLRSYGPRPEGFDRANFAWPIVFANDQSATTIALEWVRPVLARMDDRNENLAVRTALRNTYGGLLVRAGRLTEAVEQLHRSIADSPAGQGTIEDWLLLATAHAAMGRSEEATKCRARAKQFPPPTDPWHQLELKLLSKQ